MLLASSLLFYFMGKVTSGTEIVYNIFASPTTFLVVLMGSACISVLVYLAVYDEPPSILHVFSIFPPICFSMGLGSVFPLFLTIAVVLVYALILVILLVLRASRVREDDDPIEHL